MKNYKKYLFLVLFAFVGAQAAFPYSCEVSQALNGPDRCTTKVTLSSMESTLVSLGTVLVWEATALSPAQGGYQVRASRASADNNLIAGVALAGIVSGQSANILVRGPGFIRTTGSVVSGQNLWVTASAGQASNISLDAVSSDPVGVALGSNASGGSNQLIYAYIS